MSAILGFIWFIIMGGIIGWLASLVMNRDAQMGKFWNVVVGIVGSFIGNSVFSFVLGSGTIGGWPPDIMGIISALIGAVVLLGVLNLIQRGKVR
ncbi:GlsB/YeaQ/YmgE family stress response membrane protein [Erythrobacter sp. GH1-10]|uniref:GlsB/YeaQ/YmgE family stress response membrane protein n=1 Tax=Erythrobacter sp. GH1-10 TaxID=3349334 RepID=UPI003877AC2A